MSDGTPQINVSKISVSGGLAGAVVAVGGMLIFLVGIPRLRYFFAGALIVGCVLALILRFIRRETPGQPWILSDTQSNEPPRTPQAAPKNHILAFGNSA